MGRLTEELKKRDMSVTVLAKKSGVNRSILSCVINGKGALSQKHYEAVASAIGVPVNELFFGIDIPDPSESAKKYKQTIPWKMLDGRCDYSPVQCGEFSYRLFSSWFHNSADVRNADGYVLGYDEQVIVGTGIDFYASMELLEEPLRARIVVTSDLVVYHEIRVTEQPICFDGELAVALYCHSGRQIRLLKNTQFATIVV